MGQAKICVKCPTEAEMYDIQAKAQAAGLVNHLVVRNGWISLWGQARCCWNVPRTCDLQQHVRAVFLSSP